MKPIVVAAALAASGRASAAPSYETYAKLYDRLMNGATAAQLEDALPGLAGNLRTANEVSARYWTASTPYDELAKAYILPDRVMDALGIRREKTEGVVHVPAGLMHTYGYLFSQLKTAYGLKGKRWIESRLDERLGLPAGTFSPVAPRGEFTSNVTSVLLQLIGAKAQIPTAAKLRPRAKVAGRIEQAVRWSGPGGESVFTYLVELKPLPRFETADTHLLIYETFDGKEHRLVTAFPVDRKFAETIMKTPPSSSAAFAPRFNLYFPPSRTVLSQKNGGFQPR